MGTDTLFTRTNTDPRNELIYPTVRAVSIYNLDVGVLVVIVLAGNVSTVFAARSGSSVLGDISFSGLIKL